MAELLDSISRYGLVLSWQVALVIALVWAIAGLLGERWTRCRYTLWLVVLGRLLVPVVLVTPIGLLPSELAGAPAGEVLAVEAGASMTVPSPARPHLGSAEPARPEPRTHRYLPRLLVLGWIVGASALALATVIRHRRLRRTVEHAAPPAGPLVRFIESRRLALGLPEPVEAKVMPRGGPQPGPALIGLFRPSLIVPWAFDRRWQESLHGPLVLHELMHLKRRDPWVNLAVAVARVAWFFHPLVWVATGLLLRERERLCDDDVVEHYGDSPGPYVQALCRHALHLPSRKPSGVGIFLARSRSELVQRIERLSALGSRREGRWAAAGMLLAGGLVLAVTAGGVGAPGAGGAVRLPGATSEAAALARQLELSLTRPDGVFRAGRAALRLVHDHPAMPTEAGQMAAIGLLEAELEERGGRLWLAHLRARPDDPAILRNAALFFERTDAERAMGLLERGRDLEPTQWWWPAQIGLLNRRPSPGETREEALLRLEGSRADLLAALALRPPPPARVRLLGRAARAAFATGRLGEAEALARRQLVEASAIAGTWYHGNALHVGRLTIGEVALRRGDLETAGAWLITAAEVPPSPQLRTFGPNTSLADDLLRRGLTEPVARYLEACAAFSEHPSSRLESWAAEIRAGRAPDLGAGRSYHF